MDETMDYLRLYDANNWYWIVAGDESRLWASARMGYVPPDDAALSVWLASGGVPTRIANEYELQQVLLQQAPDVAPDRRFTPAEVFAALSRIDAAKVRAALGLAASADLAKHTLREGDAAALAALAEKLAGRGAEAPAIAAAE